MISGGSVTAEHTPPTAAEVALDVLMKDWDAWAERGQWASPASRDRRRSRVARGHRAMIAKLAAAGLLRPDTPPPTIVQGNRILAWCSKHDDVAWLYDDWSVQCMHQLVVEGSSTSCVIEEIRGLVAGSDDSTDTLIEQLLAIDRCDFVGIYDDARSHRVMRFAVSAYEGAGDDREWLAGARGDTLNAALRTALASQPKGT